MRFRHASTDKVKKGLGLVEEMTMGKTLTALWKQEDGQDIVEYTLLIAFVTFMTAALFIFGAGGSLVGIWTSGSNQLAAANSTAS